MPYSDILVAFCNKFYQLYVDKLTGFAPYSKNAIQVSLTGMPDMIFTYINDYNWSLQTVSPCGDILG